MFNLDFYPTPPEVAILMIEAIGDIKGKKILEPSAGSGNLVLALQQRGAEVIACENDEKLAHIAQKYCPLVARDFFTLVPEQISHINAIVMNPPFSKAAKHIMHAWEIAPEGCTIIALCNYATIENTYSRGRESLKGTIDDYGYSVNLGNCFSQAERKTDVEVAMIFLQKPASNYDAEFEGFFLEEDPEEAQEEGMIQYDVIRDIVNRYVAAVKLYDKQLELGVQMGTLIDSFPSLYKEDESMNYMVAHQKDLEKDRARFKKGLQKRAWNFLFKLLDMERYSTKGLREDINKFVENQLHIPFTMRNVYKMLEIVVGTRGSRMDKALVEVFDFLTERYHENRWGREGWKTNSNYLVNQKFIMEGLCWQDQRWYKGQDKIECSWSSMDKMDDIVKALCYLTGDDYGNHLRLSTASREHYVVTLDGKHYGVYGDKRDADAVVDEIRWKGTAGLATIIPKYGEWFEWSYFEVKAFKKGTMHFKFKSEDLWATFNQNIARIKGFVLPESHGSRKAYQTNFFKDKQDAA